MKTCSSCKIEYPENDFPPNSRKKSGLNGKCRTCYNQYMREYHAANRDKHMIRVKARNDKALREVRNYIKEYLQNNPCVTCGEDDIVVLDFDHIDRNTKTSTISSMIRRRVSMVKLQEEINKCQVLCANCHRRRTAKQMGWYRLLA